MADLSCSIRHDTVDEILLTELSGYIGKEWLDIGRYLGVPDSKLQSVIADNPSNRKEAIFQSLLTWKRGNSDPTCTWLCNALRAADRTDLADYLQIRTSFNQNIPSRTSLSYDEKVADFVESLKQKYQLWCHLIRPNPSKEECKVHLQELFVDVHLSKFVFRNGKHKWEPLPKGLQSLFLDEHLKNANKIIIEGDPGYGKTTMFYHLADLWCQGRDVMELKKLFVLLPLKRVKVNASIYKSIKDILLPKDTLINEEDIKDILAGAAGSVVALDGLDEFPGRNVEEYESSDVMAILRHEMLQKLKVFLSTRSSCLPDVSDCDVVRIKLNRFTDAQRQMYIQKVFPTDQQRGNMILSAIKENDFMSDLAEVPLLFSLIVHVLGDDLASGMEVKFDGVTQFFKYIVTCFKGHLKTKRFQQVTTDKKDDTKEEDINEIAYDGLMPQSKKLAWRKEKVYEAKSYQLMVNMGILIEEEGDVDVETSLDDLNLRSTDVRFFHRTFQEWFGAHYLSKVLETHEEFKENLRNITNPWELQYLLRFSCGMSKRVPKIILEFIASLPDDDRNSDLFFLCLYESIGEKHLWKDAVTSMCHKIQTIQLMHEEAKFLSKSKALFLRLAHEWKTPVPEVNINASALTAESVCEDLIKLKTDVNVTPFSTKFLRIYRWYGPQFAIFLKRCEKLEEIRIYTEYLPYQPSGIQQHLGKCPIKVTLNFNMQLYEMRNGEWECVHQKDICQACGTTPIIGLHWKCKTCSNSLFCESCMMRGNHKDHKRFPVTGSLIDLMPLNPSRKILCNKCQLRNVGRSGFQCKVCPYYFLCNHCKNEGNHQDHGLQSRCDKCFGLNLCKDCQDEVTRTKKSLALYEHMKCSNCNNYIQRTMFYCKECKGYKLCQSCKTTGVQPCHEQQQLTQHDRTEDSGDVECHHCNTNILGVFFKCRSCRGEKYKYTRGFILCSNCKSNGIHAEHEFKELQCKEVEHYLIECNACRVGAGEPPFDALVGVRYRCKTCKWYNLCEQCNYEGIHSYHEFEEWTVSQF
ncbi:NLR family CARD domain-containing protein 4 [Holothuria leucospilota]|uniref:NLR family CARD domain-containing protein 4 n=1 Tax=Holothuria leucospilota TaxID=206669 RepID=A0A9Q1BSB2_HOLLE|nr:NLR family CARD domain-containing protein 4 [Holothuria leucospilota]